MLSFEQNSWDFLHEFTQARIAIGRAGTSLPSYFLLDFRMAHAEARDAVYSELDSIKISQDLSVGASVIELHTQATDRLNYLKKPHLGKILAEEAACRLPTGSKYDIVFVVADGLSATAVNRHAANLLNQVVPYLQSKHWEIAPICLLRQGRVACADEIGEILGAKISVMMIGERPGLSAADSLGIYLTFAPKVGTTDESRNCISNVRPEGLDYERAVQKLIYLIETINARQISGVHLKDEQELFHNTPIPKII
ncbi:MAG: ethanolamine ammonia-lyase subunit EutC [Cytophagales bacterium]|nr:MAG: ethanolamine ammonia-lyase subunit EutC [Cytophagales bacterium]